MWKMRSGARQITQVSTKFVFALLTGVNYSGTVFILGISDGVLTLGSTIITL